MSNAKQVQPASNVSQTFSAYPISLTKLISCYEAVQEIVSLPEEMTPQKQNITMRAIAKKALGL